MLKIGITGGIGSGKSTVCRIFGILGIPVFNADEESKFLLENDPEIVSSIKSFFGSAVYHEHHINRKALASIVFNNPEKLAVLNSVMHPAVFKKLDAWLDSQAGHAYVLKEAALIFETRTDSALDGVILVSAPETLRIKRVMQRDGSSESEIRKRMNNQMPEAEKLKRATYFITNDDHAMLIPQVLELHQKLLKRALTQSN